MQPKWIVWENVPGVLSSGKGRDFGTFLGALAELGYGFAYRVLDAQWFGVAQRRRRVFVVAHARDWRRAAAVLFERESLFGDSPTRGATGEGSTSGFADGFGGGLAKPLGSHALSKGRGTDLDNTTYVTFAQNQREEVRDLGDCTTALNLQGTHHQTFLATPYTKAKRAQSNKDDETWVPSEVSPTMSCFDQGDTRATTVVAFANRTRDGIKVPEVMKDGVVPALTNPGDGGRSDAVNVATPVAVRRLTPRECERLQGFPDDYTLVTYRNKPAADGPRYRALGNSMAAPVMRWIGERIAMVDAMP
jgi:DNA (cytosine-5)-methyltransferase 1